MKPQIQNQISFVLASTNHGSLLVNRHDYRSVGDVTYGVGYQLLQTSAFDPAEINVALQLLQARRAHFGDGLMAVDCGANIGVHTVEWAHFMTGWGRVLAIEAQERIFYALAGNIALNNCFNARAVWAAVGSTAGSIGVPVVDYSVPSSFGSLELRKTPATENIGQTVDYARVQPTDMVAIDDLKLTRLDLLKIDVEGMEMEVLQGAHQTLFRTQPILIIERIKIDEVRLDAFLRSLGYRVFAMGINVLAIHTSDPTLARFRREPTNTQSAQAAPAL